jgi:Zn-dependent M28 family amino/carboxypeptidase
LSVPLLLVFVLNAEIVLRNQVVPGAADNLSGCAAQIVLAEAWAKNAPSNVELVFAFTGAEEAGTGGAGHLARTAGWDPSITDVVALDTLSNGTLYLLEEGELFAMPMPETLVREARAAAADASQPAPAVYPVPAGGTDALPFLVEGFRALALTCIDPVQHAPRNYHHPSDTADRVEPTQLVASTEIALALLRRLGGIQGDPQRAPKELS